MAETMWGEYLKLLGKVGRTLEELTGIEQTKTRAAMQGDLESMEKCMKREQALSMSLRGLDRKRESMMEQLGMKGVPLRGIMDHCPEGAEAETEAAADALRRQYSIFQAASEVARNTLECNLRVIENMMKQHNGGEPIQETPPAQSDFRC